MKIKVEKFIQAIRNFKLKPFIRGGYENSMEKSKKDYVLAKYGKIPTVDLLDLSPNFKETIEPYTYLAQTCQPIDLALLKQMARKYKKCRYLEIGTWRGESIANVSQVADKCVSISLSDDELRKYGRKEEYIRLQRFFSKNLKNVKHIKQDSHTFDYTKFKEKFDLIFVDGDHSYTGVKIDTKNVFKVIHKNSMIVWHDAGKDNENTNWTTLAGILDGTPKERRKYVYKVSNTMCAIYYPFPIKSKVLKFPQFPNKNFNIKIKLSKPGPMKSK